MTSGEEQGPAGFFAPGLVVGGRYHVFVNKIWFSGELNTGFSGTMNVQLFSAQGGGFSGVTSAIGDFGLGVIFDFSAGRIFGMNSQYLDASCQDCSNPEILQLESYFYGYATSFGPVLTYSFPLKDIFGMELRVGSRFDTFRWYTWGAISSTIKLGQ